MALAWCEDCCFLAPECNFQKVLFFMNYFDKMPQLRKLFLCFFLLVPLFL